jgi:outer membrane lipoprotein-sorting protein
LKTKLLSLLLFICLFPTIYAQSTTANQLLNKVYSKIQQAKDYTVNANVTVDLPFIRMLPIDAKIYFKQKDKFKVASKSIAIVPRQGFDQLTKMLNDTTSFTSLLQANEKINTTDVSVVNIIPLSDTSDLILGKLWIDYKNNLVLKSQLTTKTNGTIVTEYFYTSQINYGLPDKMVFTVDVKKFKIPKGVAADINNSQTAKEDDGKKEKKGKIIIVLSNYQINKGIKDEVFKK